MTWQEPADKLTDRSEAFVRMAARIELNAKEDFAGAFVIVAPDGTQKSVLLLDNSQSAATFWGILQSTAQIALAELDAQERMGQSAYGRR